MMNRSDVAELLALLVACTAVTFALLFGFHSVGLTALSMTDCWIMAMLLLLGIRLALKRYGSARTEGKS